MMTSPRADEAHAAEIAAAMRSAYDELIAVASSLPFQELLDELYAIPAAERPDFVNSVVMSPTELSQRGVVIPPGILVQRSAFGDRRPTLFCLKKYLPERLQTHWQNANITFDNQFEDSSVPRDARAWRTPLAIQAQQDVIAGRSSDLSP